MENEKGLQMVDSTVKLIIEMVKLNMLLGYEKFSITKLLCEAGELIEKFGFGDAPIHDMQLLVIEYSLKKLKNIDLREAV